jgi:hypothetical protein
MGGPGAGEGVAGGPRSPAMTSLLRDCSNFALAECLEAR